MGWRVCGYLSSQKYKVTLIKSDEWNPFNLNHSFFSYRNKNTGRPKRENSTQPGSKGIADTGWRTYL